jgi:hypothetical protein
MSSAMMEVTFDLVVLGQKTLALNVLMTIKLQRSIADFHTHYYLLDTNGGGSRDPVNEASYKICRHGL